MARHRLIPWAAALVVMVAGCSDRAGGFDRTETLRLANTELDSALPIGIASVDCPELPGREAGDRRSCTARTDDDRTVRFDLVANGSEALRVEVRDAVLERDPLVDRIDAELEAAYDRSFTVVCDEPEVVIVDPGSTFTCRAEDEDHEGEVEVTVLDLDGDVDVRIGAVEVSEPQGQAVP